MAKIKTLLQTGVSALCTNIKQIRKTAELAGSAALSLAEALLGHAQDTGNPHEVTAAQVGALPLSGGTLTGNLNGKYITGTWLQGTSPNALNSTPQRICVQDSNGWVYSRTPAQILSDIGAQAKISNTTFSIPASGWTADSSAAGFGYYKDFDVSGLTENDLVNVTVQASGSAAADKACFAAVESMAGKFRLRVKNVPESAISAVYTIVKGG